MKHFRVWFICGRFCVHEADHYVEDEGCVTFYDGPQSCQGGRHVAAIIERIEESPSPFPVTVCPVVEGHERPPAGRQKT